MPTSKQAIIRYHALDKCFGNTGRKYSFQDLLGACNQALAEAVGNQVTVSRRQVYDDINFMESEDGYAVDLERTREGRRVYYRYADPSFSIRNQPINEAERVQLEGVLELLNRFGGMPQFDWLNEVKVRLASQDMEGEAPLVIFEQNPYLAGNSQFWPLFQAIQHQRVLKVKYQGFRHPHMIEIFFHPYLLKEYNNRWFVFGWNDGVSVIANLPLDRIQEFEEIDRPFQPNSTFDPETYFDDIIGVSRRREEKPEMIRLWVALSLWPYLETKPIHGSQKILNRRERGIEIQLELIINFELKSLLLSFGEEIEVIAPDQLRSEIRDRILLMKSRYEK